MEIERQKAEAAQKEAEVAQKEAEAAQKEAEAAQKEAAEARQKVTEARREQVISLHILRMLRQGASDEEIVWSIMRHFSLDEKQAAEKLALAFGDSDAKE